MGSWHLQDPGVADESLYDRRVACARRDLQRLLEREGIQYECEPLPPLYGDDVVWHIAEQAVAGALGSAVVLVGERIVRAIGKFLRASRSSKTAEPAYADRQLLTLLAIDEARQHNPRLRPVLVQSLPDGEEVFAEASEMGAGPGVEADKLAFPHGIIVVRVPDAHRRQTHLVQIRSTGEIISHHVSNYLPHDVLRRIENEALEAHESSPSESNCAQRPSATDVEAAAGVETTAPKKAQPAPKKAPPPKKAPKKAKSAPKKARTRRRG